MAVPSTPPASTTSGSDEPVERSRKKPGRTRIEPYLLLLPSLALLVFVFVWPTLFNIQLSFFDVNLISISQGGPFVGLADLALEQMAALTPAERTERAKAAWRKRRAKKAEKEAKK